jgi:hypothetical protein
MRRGGRERGFRCLPRRRVLTPPGERKGLVRGGIPSANPVGKSLRS